MLDYLAKHRTQFLFLSLGFIILVNNWSIVLWNQDEAAYAGFGMNMIKNGNYLVPEFIWSDAHRKTPFHFWMIVVNFFIFGCNEFATRFSSSLFVFTTFVLLYKQVTHFINAKTAFWAVAFLGTNLFVPALAKVAVTDATVLFFSTLCGFSILRLLEENHLKWKLFFWLGLALGVLTKGPQILIFIGFFGLAILLFHKDRMKLWRLQPWFYLIPALAPLFYWGYLAWQSDDGVFISWLIDWYILRRVSDNVYGQTGPPGYYLATMLAFFLPWLIFFPITIYKAIKSFKQKNEIYFLFALWLFGGWLIYELLSSKLPAYVLASYPALAILMAREAIKYMENGNQTYYKVMGWIQWSIHLAICIAIPIALNKFLDGIAITSSLCFGLSLFIGSTAFLYFNTKKQYSKSIYSLLFGAIIALYIAWTGMMYEAKPLFNGTKNIAIEMSNQFKPEAEVNIMHSFPKLPSLPFYVGRVFTNYYEEEDMNITKQKLKGSTPFVAILKQEQYEALWEAYPKIEIRSYVIDRQNFNNYIIVYNEPALLEK